MLTKRQFLTCYDESVSAIRQIKLFNDKLNKKLGVTSIHSLLRENEVQNEVVDNISGKVEQMINKMQRSYLDPETARKIGTIKQQYRSQKDRRKLLVDNLNEMSLTMHEQKKMLSNKQIANNRLSRTFEMQQNPYNPYYNNASSQPNNSLYRKIAQGKQTIVTSNTGESSNRTTMMQINDFDYEMQRKLINQKNSQIGQAHQQIVRVKGLMDQTSTYVNQQGDMLDIIGDDLFTAYQNTHVATQELTQAGQQQKKSRKKICVLVMLLLMALAISMTILLKIV